MAPGDVEAVIPVVAKAFHAGEPVTGAGGAPLADFVAFCRMYVPRMAKEGNTILAMSAASNEVLGAFLCEGVWRLRQYIWPRVFGGTDCINSTYCAPTLCIRSCEPAHVKCAPPITMHNMHQEGLTYFPLPLPIPLAPMPASMRFF